MYHSLFFNLPATTSIYTLSLHDALPISVEYSSTTPAQRSPVAIGNAAAVISPARRASAARGSFGSACADVTHEDRKSTRLNSSHGYISYAVFCLKKKKRITNASTCDTPI